MFILFIHTTVYREQRNRTGFKRKEKFALYFMLFVYWYVFIVGIEDTL